jgi:TRAP-type C4-dicarboxylate transport system substrate-binding protein
VQLGTIEFAIAIGEFLVGLDKRFGVVSAPGVFDDIAHGYRAVHDPEFVREYWPLGEPKGVKLIAMYCPTETNFVSRAPIATLNDFKGKKVRVFPTAMERETLRVLGATAAPMPTDEVLPALQQGVIDGAKMAMTVFVAFKVQTVAKYAIRSNEALICPMAIVSKSWWDKQPEAMRKLMLEEAAAVDEEVQKYSVEFNENSYREWEKGGGLLQVPTPAERAAMMRQLAPVGDAVAKGDPELEPTYAMLKRVAERTRQK